MPELCAYPDCGEPAICQCDNCDVRFCADHGTRGGDREGREGEITQAVPSACWRCGGFNADE
jgi:hypothetical protein